jgi:hypothetical protein
VSGVFKFFEKWGIHPAVVLAPVSVIAAVFIIWFSTGNDYLVGSAFSWAFFFAPFWLPVALVTVAWPVWNNYVRAKFIASQKMLLLEIRIPRDIMKSPRAMEAVFDGLSIAGGEATFIQRNIEGRVRPWFSFELASIEGQVHFYLWTRAGLRDLVEAEIYAQYPTVEIYDVDDYATSYHYDPASQGAWGCDFNLTKADVYPIKSYIDYELDKDPKEEFKIDPISHLFEILSTVGPGEQMWLQIMFRVHSDKQPKVLTRDEKTNKPAKLALFAKESGNRWQFDAAEEIASIKKKATPVRKDKEGNEIVGFPNPTSGDIEKIKAIERSLGKSPFDVGIRGLYVFNNDAFKAIRINSLTALFKQFGSGNLNGIKPTGWFTKFTWPWQGAFGGKDRMKHEIIDAYKRRSFFYAPHKGHPFVMTSEELATIYHFPSRTIVAPGLARIPATKVGAPANLPF